MRSVTFLALFIVAIAPGVPAHAQTSHNSDRIESVVASRALIESRPRAGSRSGG